MRENPGPLIRQPRISLRFIVGYVSALSGPSQGT
jgi:hypothetical protein